VLAIRARPAVPAGGPHRIDCNVVGRGDPCRFRSIARGPSAFREERRGAPRHRARPARFKDAISAPREPEERTEPAELAT